MDNRKDLLEERERIMEQRARLKDRPVNLFEFAANKGRSETVRPGSVDDKTRAIDRRYVEPGKGDKVAAAAWDARMNQLDSRLQDINEALKRADSKSAELGQRVQRVLRGERSDEYRKGGKVKAKAPSRGRGDGIAQRGKTRGRMV